MEHIETLIKRLREMNRDIEGMLRMGLQSPTDGDNFCEATKARQELEMKILTHSTLHSIDFKDIDDVLKNDDLETITLNLN